MDYPLIYESLTPEEFEAAMPFTTEDYHYQCEDSLCKLDATVEWESRDEDGDVYYTYRCDGHPVKDPEFAVRDL